MDLFSFHLCKFSFVYCNVFIFRNKWILDFLVFIFASFHYIILFSRRPIAYWDKPETDWNNSQILSCQVKNRPQNSVTKCSKVSSNTLVYVILFEEETNSKTILPLISWILQSIFLFCFGSCIVFEFWLIDCANCRLFVDRTCSHLIYIQIHWFFFSMRFNYAITIISNYERKCKKSLCARINKNETPSLTQTFFSVYVRLQIISTVCIYK